MLKFYVSQTLKKKIIFAKDKLYYAANFLIITVRSKFIKMMKKEDKIERNVIAPSGMLLASAFFLIIC